MRARLAKASLLGIVGLAICCFSVTPVAAATFNQNNIINDVVFDNNVTMGASDIDTFLNTFPSSCISSNNGFAAIDPTGYSPTAGFLYGGDTTAGKVIADAANAYNINPEVLLATLQKEQSLVDGSAGCSTLRYAGAAGYGCPDGGTTYNYSGVNLYSINGTPVTSVSGTCVNTSLKVGFSQQVIRAAWLLKFGEQRSEGNINWAIIKGSWNNSDDPQSCYSGPMTQGTWVVCPSGAAAYYDGYTTIDSTAVHMDDGATAALYWYTPHFAGNQNFFNIFNNWFGSPYVGNQAYSWNVDGQQAFNDSGYTKQFTDGVAIAPGQKAYLKVLARNFGYKAWDQSVVHLGTSYTRDRSSIFADSSWLSPQRIGMQETSVLPGSDATFAFSITAPSTPGTYVEHFSVVADGITWLNDPGLYYTIDVVNPTTASNPQSSTLTAGQYITSGTPLFSPDMQTDLVLLPSGNVTLYGDFKPVWASGTSDSAAASLVMQYDGNLVAYDQQGTPIWASSTSGTGNYATVQTDGNLVVYSQSATSLWSSNTTSTPNHLSRVNESLPQNAFMYPGQTVETADRAYTLVMQYDGNLVEYDNSTGKPVWATGTSGSIAGAAMQTDGNLVLYNAAGKPVWASGTAGTGNSLILQPDGSLSMQNAGGGVLWGGRVLQSGQYLTTADRAYTLVMQYDGNLVEYDNSTGKPVWATGTSGSNNAMVMQYDGNLVIYNPAGKALWATGTSGSRSSLALQHDSNLVIYTPTGSPLWATNK